LRRDKEGRPLYFMTTVSDITERKHAEEELRRSERRETILNRIASAFLTVGDDRMYEEVLAIVLEAMESQFGVFGFIADNGDLVIPTMTREIWADCQVPGKSMAFPPATWGDSLWGRALQEQKVFRSNGPFHTPPGHIPIDSFLTIPIVFRDRTIGLLSLANRARGYTAADQDLLQSIADYFSPVLNARLERDRQERQREEAEGKLRESEAKYRELFENAREAIVILDLDGTITDINPFVEEYGFHRTDLIGRNHLELVVESYREKAVQDWALLRQGIPQEGEYELRTPKGTIVVHYKDCPITREGQVIRVQSTITDVTERRRAEDALRHSEAKYHMLHDSLRDGFISVDMEGHILEFNRIYQEMLGYAEEELHQLTYQDLTPPEWHEMEERIVNDQILARGYSDVYEKEYRRKDGTVFPIELRSVLLRDAHDRPMGVWALIRDITKRKQGEEALRESEARYRLLANYASDIIWTTDLNLQLTYCSPSVERILGYTLEEALARKADEDLTPASQELVQKTLGEEMEIERTGQGDPLRSRVIEVEEICKDGTTLWAEIRAGFLRDANGAALGIVGVTRDISERRKLEREIVVREKYLNSFFTGATAGLALLDKDLRYVQINDTLAEMNGVPAQEHRGRTIREVLPRLAPMVEPILRKVLATGAPVLNVEVAGPTRKDPSVPR
jgi:PAS domain S-box-containing protein